MKSNEIINEFFVDAFNKILESEKQGLKELGMVNITLSEIHVLEAVSKSESKHMNIIAKRLGITNGTLTTSSKKLESKGYLVRKVSNYDNRLKSLVLTKKGEKALEIHDIWHHKLMEDILHILEEEELEILEKALTKVISKQNLGEL